MNHVQKLEATELVLRSLTVDAERAESPRCHKTVLESRFAKVEAGDGKFLTLEQLKKRLAQRTK